MFSREGDNTDLLKNKQVVQAAFSHDVLELGNNSEPIQLDNDSVVVLRVNKHVLAAEKPFSEVKAVIYERLANQQAASEAMRVGKEFLSLSNDAIQRHALFEKNKLHWVSVKHANRDGDDGYGEGDEETPVPAVVNELAFTLNHPNEKNGNTLENGDYVIVSLNAMNEGEVSSLDKEHTNSIVQQIEANYGVMDYDLYLSGLMSKATIVKH